MPVSAPSQLNHGSGPGLTVSHSQCPPRPRAQVRQTCSSRAELGAVRALTSRKLTLRGNMAKALRLAPLVDKLNKVLATIPTDY